MTAALQTALLTRYNASAGAALRAATVGLWEGVAPASTSTALPVVTMLVVASSADYSMGQDFFRVRVQFSVFTRNASSKAAADAAQLLIELYNTQLLTMGSGYTMLRADPVAPGRTLQEPDSSGWQVVVEMEYLLQRSR